MVQLFEHLTPMTVSFPMAKLPVYTATVAFHLCRIVFDREIAAVSTLNSAIKNMCNEAATGNYRHVDKPRLFLAARPAISSLCFTAFYRYHDLPFETANLASHREMERVYAQHGKDIFFECTGVVRFDSRQKKTDRGSFTYRVMFVEWKPFHESHPNVMLKIECDRCYHDTRNGYVLGDDTFGDGTQVNFHLTIRESIGLFAIGLRLVSLA
jgi:hypothetical protein